MAASIGTTAFHRNLLGLFGRCIRSDSGWIIRYSRVAPPDVLHTSNVPAEIVEFYHKKCLNIDPFSLYWKNHGRPGVLTLAELKNTGPESILYTKIFTAAANISDEIGMFFSTVGHCCFGVFLEREKGVFTPSDIRRANLIFPALEGFHKSHLGQLFNNLRRNDAPEAMKLIRSPSSIRDRHNLEVFATDSWRTALASDPTIGPLIETVKPDESVQTLLTRDYLLRTESFDRDFPLAPGGRIFTLESKPSPTIAPINYQATAALLQSLTPRERGVLTMVMKGESTARIAQTLRISKGTVKNCKIRIYRKADVNSERDLVRSLGQFFPSP
ncbi:LuxR C-terminal-related transcriptional regulator [Methylorubrum rhodesianum]|uniref:LuxR C-terminal-related transcriptional regulator n=1 Tax=Methylorubrum rhodesianum TaxID=29427 RepID=A0ABU9ZGK2_9HYPH|nr:LuxR C-terminal-related transcriptional regulator [Methylorubrum rhodesianum]